ncbi:hypothetical protein DPEC_G00282940 [Dallia pectoralis]|uniref:Uncharacterized protein n=1 Tax=Dallia pectoralis TaxID=75939 RepID=A0ACC2FJ10_DALPE|nr:hypothetical protein DPEC_G00282940 [Dallia pectoralis]
MVGQLTPYSASQTTLPSPRNSSLQASRLIPLTETSPGVRRQHKVLRAQLAHIDQIQRQTGDRFSVDVGTTTNNSTPPPPLNSKPTPLFLSTNAKAQTQPASAHGEENECQAAGMFLQQTGCRRLEREERLGKGRIKCDMSTGGEPEMAKLAQHSHGVWQSRALRGEKLEKCMRAEKVQKDIRKSARPELPENLLEGWSGKAFRGMAVVRKTTYLMFDRKNRHSDQLRVWKCASDLEERGKSLLVHIKKMFSVQQQASGIAKSPL